MEAIGHLSRGRSRRAGDRIKVGRVFWPVFLGVTTFYLFFYVSAIVGLASYSGSMRNKFSSLAVDKHMEFLVWQNVLVLKGYVIIVLLYTLTLVPILAWVLKWKKRWVGKWGVYWRALVFCGLFFALFVLRLLHTRPYFMNDSDFGHWYFKVLDALPEGVKTGVFFLLFTILPMIVVTGVLVYWGHYLVRWVGGRQVWFKRVSYAVVVMVTVGIGLGYWLGRKPAKVVQIEGKPYNILVLTSDSLRGDRLSCNGYDPYSEAPYNRRVSPHIDALADKSVNFTRCMTPIASTLESTITAMTSQYPHTHGVRHMYPNKGQVQAIQDKTHPLAWVLRQRGYNTAVLGDWCGGIYHVVPLGFEDVEVSDYDNFKIYMSQAVFMSHFVVPLYFDNKAGYELFPVLESFAQFLTPDVVTDRVVQRIERNTDSKKPFFWHVFYSCNHLKYHSPRPYCTMYSEPGYNGPNKTEVDFDVDGFIGSTDITDKWRMLPKKEIRQINALYDGCTTEFDDCVGRIIGALRETGQLENTIVIVTSDHGDDLFEPNATFGHGVTFNGGDQSNNVPLIVYVPGMEGKAAKVDKVVRTIDMAPTLLDVLGMEIPESWEGRSLMGYMEGGKPNVNMPFYGETSYMFVRRYIPGEKTLHLPALDSTSYIDEEFDYHFVLKDKYQQTVVDTKELCLRTNRWKLVFTPGEEYLIKRLYDQQKDPHCEVDVSKENPVVFQQMCDALELWRDENKELSEEEIYALPVASVDPVVEASAGESLVVPADVPSMNEASAPVEGAAEGPAGM